MHEPLTEFPPEAAAELQTRMDDHLARDARERFPRTMFRWPTEGDAKLATSVDWIAFPERVQTCLGRRTAMRLLDIADERVGDGGHRLQEEYAEWRVVRSDRGIEQVDLTTETSDYWRLLAAYAPERALQLVAKFADEEEVDPSLLYGSVQPFARETTPEMRESAFASVMLSGGSSPYNNGLRAITCMVHPSNSIEALLGLCVAASNPVAVIDRDGGTSRCPTCIELAPTLESAAQLGRASDPLIVERLARLAFEGRRVCLDTPGPLAISGIEYARLRTPSGEPIPTEWFKLSRPLRSEARYQRLSLSVPQDQNLCVSHLVDIATEEKIGTGAQIADLVQISLYLRTTEPMDDDRSELDLALEPQSVSCEDLVDIAANLELRSRG